MRNFLLPLVNSFVLVGYKKIESHEWAKILLLFIPRQSDIEAMTSGIRRRSFLALFAKAVELRKVRREGTAVFCRGLWLQCIRIDRMSLSECL